MRPDQQLLGLVEEFVTNQRWTIYEKNEEAWAEFFEDLHRGM